MNRAVGAAVIAIVGLSSMTASAQVWGRKETIDRMTDKASFQIGVKRSGGSEVLMFSCAKGDPDIIGGISGASWPTDGRRSYGQKMQYRVDRLPPANGIGIVGRGDVLLFHPETAPPLLNAVAAGGASLALRVMFRDTGVDAEFSLSGAGKEVAWLKGKCGAK